ncbi:PQQ-binding-like beta-propeller repeat protein [Candidatus Micrarchaeota archaeon]|nr:PQQ-binding-like beta-propeller repeat protein [Candidatus Micrarchaeota archaeon]
MRLHFLFLVLLISGIVSSASIKWSFETNGTIDSSPARAFGLIYASSSDGKLYAVNENTGQLRWSFATKGPIYGSSPVLKGNAVYVGSTDGNLYSVDANTGKEKWKFKTNGSIWGSSPTLRGNIIYIGSTDGNVYAVNADTGNEVWRFATKGKVYSTPYFSNLVVYFGSADGNLYAVDSNTGRVKWSAATDSSIWTSSPVVDERGNVYIGAIDGRLYAFDSRTGARKWTFETSGWILSTPIVVNEVIYFGSNDKNVYAVDSNGNLKWKFKADGEIQGSFTYTIIPSGTRVIYFGSNDKNVYGINDNGELLWKKELGSWVHSTPLVIENRLFVGSYDNKLYSLSTLSCTLLSPQPGTDVYDTISITGTAFADKGVRSVKLRVGETGVFEDVAGSPENWAYELIATNIEPGEFNVYCKASDITGDEEVEPYESLALFKARGNRVMNVTAPREVGIGQTFEVRTIFEGKPLQNVKVVVEGKDYETNLNGSLRLSFQKEGEKRLNFFKGGFQDTVTVVVVRQDNTMLYVVLGVSLIVGLLIIIFLVRRFFKR